LKANSKDDDDFDDFYENLEKKTLFGTIHANILVMQRLEQDLSDFLHLNTFED